jgi:hypothetical protein
MALSALHVVTAAEAAPSLSPAREALAAAIAEADRARERVEAAQAPVGKLETLQQWLRDAETALAEARAQDEAALGEWLAHCRGARPENPSTATVSAEKLGAGLARDAAAARRALPALTSARDAAIGVLREAVSRRETAVGVVIADEAAALTTALAASIEEMLQIEARLRGLATELRSHPEVASRAEAIVDGILRVKTGAGVPQRDQWAREYWNGLAADAEFAMEETQQ